MIETGTKAEVFDVEAFTRVWGRSGGKWSELLAETVGLMVRAEAPEPVYLNLARRFHSHVSLQSVDMGFVIQAVAFAAPQTAHLWQKLLVQPFTERKSPVTYEYFAGEAVLCGLFDTATVFNDRYFSEDETAMQREFPETVLAILKTQLLQRSKYGGDPAFAALSPSAQSLWSDEHKPLALEKAVRRYVEKPNGSRLEEPHMKRLRELVDGLLEHLAQVGDIGYMNLRGRERYSSKVGLAIVESLIYGILEFSSPNNRLKLVRTSL